MGQYSQTQNNPNLQMDKDFQDFMKSEQIPLRHQTVEKPLKKATIKPSTQKTTNKLVFPVLLEKEERKLEEDFKKLGIEPELKPYKPIRLNTNGKNRP